MSACGFQLRGQAELPAEMGRTYISTNDRQSIFYRKLRTSLMMNGVDVVDSPVDSSAILNILADDTGRRVLSVSARNIPREYEVYYRIEFSVEAGERTMIPLQEQVLVRDYTYDETLVLGKAREEDQLREAIADDLVRVVMFQLAAL
jgi:LPS-assembly lipoprotein